MSRKDGIGHIGLTGKDGRSAILSLIKVLLMLTEMKSRALNTKMKR